MSNGTPFGKCSPKQCLCTSKGPSLRRSFHFLFSFASEGGNGTNDLKSEETESNRQTKSFLITRPPLSNIMLGLIERRGPLAWRANDHTSRAASGSQLEKTPSKNYPVKSQDSTNLNCIDAVWGLRAEPIRRGRGEVPTCRNGIPTLYTCVA